MKTAGCDCETAAMLAVLETSGELDAEGRATLDAHIGSCPACRAERERTLETARLLAEAVAWAGLREGAESFRAAVLARLGDAARVGAPLADADGNIAQPDTGSSAHCDSAYNSGGAVGGAERLSPWQTERAVPPAADGAEKGRAHVRKQDAPVIFRDGAAASRRRWIVRRLLPAAAAVAALAAFWTAARRIYGPEPAPAFVRSGIVLAGDSPAAGGPLPPGGIEYRVAEGSPAVLSLGNDAAVRLMPGAVFSKPAARMFGRAADLALLKGIASVHAGPSAGIAVEAAGAAISGRGDFLVFVPARPAEAAGSRAGRETAACGPAERCAGRPESRADAGAAGFLSDIFAVHAAEMEAPPRGTGSARIAGSKRPAAELIVLVLSGIVDVSRAGAAGPARIGRHGVFVASPWLPRAEWGLMELVAYLNGEEKRCLWPAPGTGERREMDSYGELVETYAADLARLERIAAESGGACEAATDARDRAGRIREYLAAHRRRLEELGKRCAARGSDPARGAAMREIRNLALAALGDGAERLADGPIAANAAGAREALDACLRRLREALGRRE